MFFPSDKVNMSMSYYQVIDKSQRLNLFMQIEERKLISSGRVLWKVTHPLDEESLVKDVMLLRYTGSANERKKHNVNHIRYLLELYIYDICCVTLVIEYNVICRTVFILQLATRRAKFVFSTNKV